MTDWKTYRIGGRPWQDWLFSVAGVVFIIGLLPMLVAGTPVPLATGLSTALMLYALAIAHVSYSNWMSVAIESVAATMWLALGLS